MTLKKELSLRFHSHRWIQTRVMSPETPDSGQNWRFFCPLWPWNLTKITLKENRAPLLFHCKRLAWHRSHLRIQTGFTVRKRLNWGKMCLDGCDLDLWPWSYAWISRFVCGKNSWKFHDDTMSGSLWKWCDRQRDRRREVFLELLGRSLKCILILSIAHTKSTWA